MQSLLHYLSYWDAALAVVLVFGGLIFFHELGHFLAFRAFKVGVITFSIGMGPKLCSFKRGKTEYRLSWLPFGGYVSGVGEYSNEVESLGFTQEEAVNNRPAWQRLIIAFAGPFMNIVIAWLIYWGLTLSTGLAIPLPQAGAIVQNSAAMQAGMLPGEHEYTAIDGRHHRPLVPGARNRGRFRRAHAQGGSAAQRHPHDLRHDPHPQRTHQHFR